MSWTYQPPSENQIASDRYLCQESGGDRCRHAAPVYSPLLDGPPMGGRVRQAQPNPNRPAAQTMREINELLDRTFEARMAEREKILREQGHPAFQSDDLPEIPLDPDMTTNPEHEEISMTTAAAMNGHTNGHTRRIEHEPETLPAVAGGTIYQAIPKIMAEVGSVAKSRKNPQQGYSFRGIDDVYNAVQPLMHKYGVFLTPEVIDKTERTEETRNGGKLFYVGLTVRHTFYASDGSHVVAVTYGEGMDSGDKAGNKAMSAAMKYALIETFCIPVAGAADSETDDHDVASLPVCPDCGKSTLIKSKFDGGGFVCWGKKGGCGHKFDENDPRLTGDDATDQRPPFDADKAHGAEPAPTPLTRDDLLKALQTRRMDAGKARTVYGWFLKQCGNQPTEEQNQMFLADIEAGRFDGGEIRPRRQAA